MGLGTNQITTTTLGAGAPPAAFIPALWSDDIAARFKKNLVLGNQFTNLDFAGKAGSVVHIPSPTRSSASNIYGSQGSAISFTVATENEFTITLNQHWVNGKQFPDIAEKQALPAYRRFITDDLGYSLAVAVDSYLWTTARLLAGASQDAGAVIGGDGKTLWSATSNGNGTALTDQGIRQIIQALDDNDVPGTERFLVVPPVEKNRLLGNSRFTEQAFTGERGSQNSIRTGQIGDVYGIPVYVSSNSPSVTQGSGTFRLVLMAHKDAVILATQIRPRVQSQYKLEYLSDVLVADTAFGAAVVRTEATASLDRGRIAFVPA
jgi:hypothetical protein